MYDKKIAIINTKAHSKIVATKPDEYLLIMAIILSGIYLPIMALTSPKPILYFINVRILKKISIIAIKKTNDENLLKNITTTNIKTIKTIKSIYIITPLFFLYHFIINRDVFLVVIFIPGHF